MIDNRTEFLGLPLPNEMNELEDDCPRIIDAFRKLDASAGENDNAHQDIAAALETEKNARLDADNALAATCAELESDLASHARTLADLALPATAEKTGRVKPDNRTIAVDEAGRISLVHPVYELCEFYHFRHPTLRPGFQPCYGGLIEDAAETYPEAWQYLQTSDGQMLLKSETEWQAMTVATWHTCADGTQIGWNGIGGAPFFVQDLEAGTLRMPDLRGMFAEAAGFDSLGVGDARGDGIRNISGSIVAHNNSIMNASGCFSPFNQTYPWTGQPQTSAVGYSVTHFNADNKVPIANVNRPRSYGVLPCAYLGIPSQAQGSIP